MATRVDDGWGTVEYCELLNKKNESRCSTIERDRQCSDECKKPFQHWIKYRSKLHTIACLPVTVHNGVCDMLIAKRPGLETF